MKHYSNNWITYAELTTAPKDMTESLVLQSLTEATGDRGHKVYELSNHLGNVLATVSDKKLGIVDPDIPITHTTVSVALYYRAQVQTASDYYPFGWNLPGRSYSSGQDYRFGFNGMEANPELNDGNYDFGARVYDGRIARWWSVDKAQGSFSDWSPYNFVMNSPISIIDPGGNYPIIKITNEITGYTVARVYGKPSTQMVIPTYKAIIIDYNENKNTYTQVAEYNVTRDGWISVGSEVKENGLEVYHLLNRALEPQKEEGNLYMSGKIEADPYAKSEGVITLRSSAGKRKIPAAKVPGGKFYDDGSEINLSDMKRNDPNYATGNMIHIGGPYERKYETLEGNYTLAGYYGCFGVCSPDAVTSKEGYWSLLNGNVIQWDDGVPKDPKGNVLTSNETLSSFIKDVKKTQKAAEKRGETTPNKISVVLEGRENLNKDQKAAYKPAVEKKKKQ